MVKVRFFFPFKKSADKTKFQGSNVTDPSTEEKPHSASVACLQGQKVFQAAPEITF